MKIKYVLLTDNRDYRNAVELFIDDKLEKDWNDEY